MFGKSKSKRDVRIDTEIARKLIHDLRASHHAAKLNADAAKMLAAKVSGSEAARLQKLLGFLSHDLEKFKSHLEKLSRVVKNG